LVFSVIEGRLSPTAMLMVRVLGLRMDTHCSKPARTRKHCVSWLE
jgi:hypothetical protein